MWYDDEGTLGGLLELVIQNYEHDRSTYWSEEGVHRNIFELVDAVAASLRSASDELYSQSVQISGIDFSWPQVRYLAAHPDLISHAIDKLEIELAYESVAELRKMAIRCFELTQDVLTERPGEPVRRFLRRLGRAYTAGLVAESVILCRAVLENSLVERFDRASIPLPATPEGRSSMRTRIDAARTLNFLSDEAARSAITIWQRGNTAVHNDPDATSDALGTIRLTLLVLKELYD